MENNGTIYNRAKIWQIAGFALNNSATNCYMWFIGYISYFMTGSLGVGVVLATSFLTIMRIWDSVTDPFIGLIVDRTSTRFGKNRPFLLLGNLILIAGSGLMVCVSPLLPEVLRFPAFILMYVFYVIGYTFQNLVTKSALTCLTNDPKQRPLFTVFDGVYTTILFAALAVLYTSVLLPRHGDDFTAGFYQEAWLVTVPISLVMTIIAIISIAGKDKPENYGLEVTRKQTEKITFRDYWDVLKNNRAIQMLVVAASTDKLAMMCMSEVTIGVIVFGIICGNYDLYAAITTYTSIPSFLFLMFGAGYIATKLGQKKALMVGTWGALISCIAGVMVFYVLDPTQIAFPGFAGFNGWNFVSIAFLVVWVVYNACSGVSSTIVIPMTADCADYEVYRSGRYVPGIISTLFSFVDKLISSLAHTLVGLMCAAIGFTTALPSVNTPLTPQLKFVGVFGLFGMTIIGLIANIIAMRFYPLTKEKMEEIQTEIAAIKAKAESAPTT